MDLALRIDKTRFLGSEFLVWLWFESERSEALFELPELGALEVWLEEHITLRAEGALSAPAQSQLRGDAPSATPEAKEALRQGKLPTKAKLRITRGPQAWTFVLIADPLSLTSVGVPALVKEDSDERFYERMQLIEELEAMVFALYERFLTLRTGDAWEADVMPALRRWVQDAPQAMAAE